MLSLSAINFLEENLMQNRPRKALAIILAGLLAALMLAACGDPTATPATSNTVAVGTAASTSTTAVAAAATTAATSATTAAAQATTATVAGAATTAVKATTAAVAGATTAAGAVAPPASTACDKPVAASTNGKTYVVGVVVQNLIPDLVASIDGFKKGMEQCGFVEGKNVTYKLGNAGNDLPQLAQIARDLAPQVNLFLAVGTAALVNIYNATKDTPLPIVFTAVTNPYVALPGVIKTETDHAYITGIQALVDIEAAMKLIPESLPNAKNIGLIFNPAEINSKYLRDISVETAKKLGLNLVEASISKSDEVLPAAQSLADKVDAFYTTTDVTVVNALEALIKVSSDSKKPLFASNPQSADRGAPVALGLNYFDVGVITAPKAAAIFDGKKAETIGIERPKVMQLYVNLKGAEQMGFKIPDAVIARAVQKYDKITPPKQ